MIHNNEEQRLHYLRGKLDELAVNLIRSGSEVVRMEIVNLPTKKFDTIVYVKRILKNEKYYIGKLKIRPIGKVLRVLRLLFSLILKFVLQVFKSAKKRDDFKRQFFRKLRIEDEVSRAHLKGLEEFLESKSDYLVVFESDSVVRDSEKLCNEINKCYDNDDSCSYSYEISRNINNDNNNDNNDDDNDDDDNNNDNKVELEQVIVNNNNNNNKL